MLWTILKIAGLLFVAKAALGLLGFLWGGMNDVGDIARKWRKKKLGFGKNPDDER